MKIPRKINPKHLFQSKKSRYVSISNPSSFNSYATSVGGCDFCVNCWCFSYSGGSFLMCLAKEMVVASVLYFLWYGIDCLSKKINSYATTFSSSPQPSHRHHKSKSSGIATPTSVLPTQSLSHSHGISSDDWPEVSTDVQFDELVQAFKFIDNDGDGRITREELEAILNQIGGSEPLIREELSLMLSEIDKDGDGIITLEEFRAISSAFGPPACDTELRYVFDVFDTDHDGLITADELFAVFKSLGGERCTLEECRSMISNVDKNGDGFVCLEDFTRMMESQR